MHICGGHKEWLSYLLVHPAAFGLVWYMLHGVILLSCDVIGFFFQKAWNAVPLLHKKRVYSTLAKRSRLSSRDEKRLAPVTMSLVPAVVHHADRLDQCHLGRDILFVDVDIIHLEANHRFLKVPILVLVLVIVLVIVPYP